MQGEKVLRTVVLSDAVGFTARMQADEPAALRALASDHLVLRNYVESHQGVVVKSTGDGLLCLFESPAQAVRACLGALPEMVAMEHRLAVHMGEVTITSGDVFGDAVNICARLEREAKPGTVVASQLIADMVKAQALPVPRRAGRIVVRGVQGNLDVVVWGVDAGIRRRTVSGKKVWKWAWPTLLLVFSGGLLYDRYSAANRRQAEMDAPSIRVAKALQGGIYQPDAPDIEAIIEETYLQVLDEVAEYDEVKNQAIKTVDPKIVIDWLKRSPMGKRERGQREIEHWSLAQMAIEKAGSKDVAIVQSKLKKGSSTDQLALAAFNSEFAVKR